MGTPSRLSFRVTGGREPMGKTDALVLRLQYEGLLQGLATEIGIARRSETVEAGVEAGIETGVEAVDGKQRSGGTTTRTGIAATRTVRRIKTENGTARRRRQRRKIKSGKRRRKRRRRRRKKRREKRRRPRKQDRRDKDREKDKDRERDREKE